MTGITRRTLLYGTAIAGVAYAGPLVATDPASVRPTALAAEQMIDPEGLDTRRPRLSWQCAPAGNASPGSGQSAYRITVAESRGELLAGRLQWDTGRVVSGQTVLVPYAGPPLASGQACHWRVTIWDEHGRTATSPPARWSIGLASEEWRAAWIAAPAVAPERFDAAWIGFDAAGPNGPGHGDTTPGHTQYFRTRFTLPAGVAPGAATLRLLVDGDASIFVNGRYAGSADQSASVTSVNLPAIPAGTCVLALQIGHPSGIRRPPALAARATLHRLDGGRTEIEADATWRVADWASEGWRLPGFDDTAWSASRRLAVSADRPGEVACPAPVSGPAVMLRRSLVLDRLPRRAWLQASGLGWSELLVNGGRLGDAVLSPALTDPAHRVPSVMHEVTGAMVPGENVLAALLGRGRFAAPRSQARDFGPPCLRLQLTLEHEDGTRDVVVSDAGWSVGTDGPVRENNEYDGETYDARREAAWTLPGFDARDWPAAVIVAGPGGRMVGQACPPSRVLRRLEPVAWRQTLAGPDGSPRWITDFGQNHAGVCRLRLPMLEAGAVVTLRHAERLNLDGSLDVANLRSALATDRVIGGGGAVDVQPRFTTHGFRYAEVSGLAQAPGPGVLSSAVIGDDLRQTGRFACSNETLNAIVAAAAWSIRSNCRSIRTDCPQRDERQGWLGDPAEDCAGEAFLFDNAAFYAKWLDDIADTQRPDGALSDVAPAYLPVYADDASWPAALPAIADTLHRHFADPAPLTRHLPVMIAWLDRLLGRVVDGALPPDQWGDWGSPLGAEAARRPAALIATAYLIRSLALTQDLAGRAGAAYPDRLAAAAITLRQGFHARFFNAAAGVYGDGSATASLLPLAFDLVPAAGREALAAHLVDQVERVHGGHPCFGLVGCQWINRVLTRFGRADLALRLATQRTVPGLGAMVASGATTLWELWDGAAADPAMSSDNHTMLMGDLLTWLFGDVAGITPDPAHPGFARFTIRPTTVAGLDWVHAEHDSRRGLITSDWRVTGRRLELSVQVPPDSVATIVLPAGVSVHSAAGLRRLCPGRFEAVSGRYTVVCEH